MKCTEWIDRMGSPFHQKAKQVIRRIPKGKVATYGQIAVLAGDARGSRQVSWVLHSCSESDKLPWHRVINSQGRISLPKNMGYELQRALLSDEGIEFGLRDTIDLVRFQWRPRVTKSARSKGNRAMKPGPRSGPRGHL